MAVGDEALAVIGAADGLEAVVSSSGADVLSLRFGGVELLHNPRGRETGSGPHDDGTEPPLGWQGGCMQLFPAVGRQRGGVYSAGSARGLSMPTHGFLSGCHTPLALDTEHGVVTATWSSGKGGCRVPDGADWPFEAQLAARFSVHGDTLSVEYTVDAGPAAADGQVAPVSIGNHLSLAVPWAGKAAGGPAPSLLLRAGPAARGSPVGIPLLPAAPIDPELEPRYLDDEERKPEFYLPLTPDYPGVTKVHDLPPIYTVDDFLTGEECDRLMELGTPGLKRSIVVDGSEGKTSAPTRTSVATVLIYLNTVEDGGGGTDFPKLSKRFFPKRGTALVFFPCTLDGRLDTLALHSGLEATSPKWVCQVWIRQREFR
ncbi:hypothetical protein FNF28_04748 [Cafeteria roenbergensis]|uniref:Prolyl 4-hydroxylase alpha subunit domain-containing protein n=1 Tax=Cafeteria roenbergensis TaxID=33653 RepID=A0A5A8DBP5_CAFRO|nr:hypothetical protein FNF28_04748 [Cafeteria roenbergensis]